MVLCNVLADGVRIGAHEVFSTIAIMPAVRDVILCLANDHPEHVIGDLASLRRNVPIVYEYVPLTNARGKNRRGRPRKVQTSGL